MSPVFDDVDVAQPYDVFISYRRATGSQLASLLKVHLQLRGFKVFLDIEKLEAGKFDNMLVTSVRNARNFVVVLTVDALDRCLDDVECKDWVHREIMTAIGSKCNVIPVFSGFKWPQPERLPEDMRALVYFNGIKWIHDYQDACIDKLERFLCTDRSAGSLSGTNSPLPDMKGVTHGNPRKDSDDGLESTG